VGILVVLLLLPWTQNIRARGNVTTLRQEHRPQDIYSVIGGRITRWYVKEGDRVQQGDTIAVLAEIKDNYLDTNLLLRTREQVDAKTDAVKAYDGKIDAATAQIAAIEQIRRLKISQLNNKITQLQLKIVSDSMDAVAAGTDYRIADAQYKRQRIMRDSGLASMVQLEQRNQYLQAAAAKKISAETKYANSITDLLNTRIELQQAAQEYNEKMMKVTADRAAAQSDRAAGRGEVAKLTNQYANYSVRSGMYYLLAPQSGQIVQAKKSGLNEIIKEGEKLAEIVPDKIDHAVELYVEPMDMPLVKEGQEVRFLFDGFPAIVFSGWPTASYGTFTGRVVAIENSLSDNGKFRVLVAEMPKTKPWPAELRIGTGANAIALLNNVPIWYELWRNLNGFPPDYYSVKKKKDDSPKK
jgi:multidrug resistance efflux pump